MILNKEKYIKCLEDTMKCYQSSYEQYNDISSLKMIENIKNEIENVKNSNIQKYRY